MATRVVEGKKPYTGGEAIDIDQNKVISLKLRDENNLIIYDSGDDEIYVDLQLPDGITPTDAFPVGVTTGRVVVADGWDKAGTIICAKTTSGDNIKLLYADDGTLWIDNGTGTYKEIPLGGSAGADIEYVTQVEYDALPSSKLTDGKHYVIYTSDSPTPPSPGRQPGVNTLVYYNINDNDTNSTIYDLSGNGVDQTWSGTPGYTTDATYGRVATFDGNSCTQAGSIVDFGNEITFIVLIKTTSTSVGTVLCECASSSTRPIGVTVNISGNENRVWFSGSGEGDNVVGTSNNISTNTWYMIAGTRDSSGLAKIYINGVLNNTHQTLSDPDYTNGEALQIGRWRFGDSSMFNGQFKLFIGENRAWTDQEIADLASEYGF